MEPQTIDLLFTGLLWLGVMKVSRVGGDDPPNMSKWAALGAKISESAN